MVEDLRDRGTGSRVVLVAVPRRWGRSCVLEEFLGVVEVLDGPLMFPISCTPSAGRAAQAERLREALTTAELGSRAAGLLGLDATAGKVQLGLGIGGLFASGLAAAVPLLLTSLAVTAAGNVWDASPSGQQGAVARVARAVAAVSVAAPVLVTVDDAELFDLGLAVTMIGDLPAGMTARSWWWPRSRREVTWKPSFSRPSGTSCSAAFTRPTRTLI